MIYAHDHFNRPCAIAPATAGLAIVSDSVEPLADRLGIVVETPTTLKTPEALDAFRTHGADAAVVVAYGLLLPIAMHFVHNAVVIAVEWNQWQMIW